MRTYLTAELSRGDIERITAAVKTRLQECGVDLLDVAVYRVAAVVNERLLKTLTTTAAGGVHDDCVTGEAAMAMKLERERLVEQIDRLARCLRDVTGEFRPTEGTCDAAIRVIGEQNARIAELREQLGSARARFDAYREVVSLRSKDKP